MVALEAVPDAARAGTGGLTDEAHGLGAGLRGEAAGELTTEPIRVREPAVFLCVRVGRGDRVM